MVKSSKEKAPTTKYISDIAVDIRQLAENLDLDLSHPHQYQKKRSPGSTAFDLRVHQYKIEAGRLLEKLNELHDLKRFVGLRRIITRRPKSHADYGHYRVFEDTCRHWIPKQSDGFDYARTQRQMGEAKTCVMAMRYLADRLSALDRELAE